MKKIAILPVLLSLAACSGPTLAPGERYVSPFAGFSCDTDRLVPTTVSQEFDAHGGTVMLNNEFGMTRVDVVEFSPPLDEVMLTPARFVSDVHSSFLDSTLLPLIRQAVPNASVLGREDREIDGQKILVSAVVTPGVSRLMRGDGTYFDGIRQQAQYTNGRYMYVVTRDWWNEGDLTTDEVLKSAYKGAIKGFKACRFPGPKEVLPAKQA